MLTFVSTHVFAQITALQEKKIQATTAAYLNNLALVTKNDENAYAKIISLFNDSKHNTVINDLSTDSAPVTAQEYLNSIHDYQGKIDFKFSPPFYFYKQIAGRWQGVVKVLKQISGDQMKTYIASNILIIDAETGKIGEIRDTLPEGVIPFGSKPEEALKNMNSAQQKRIYTNGQQIEEAGLFELIYVQGGDFYFGSLASADQKGNASVRLKIPDFFIGKFEVTQEQWVAVMGYNPSRFNNCIRCPVENVDWYDAVAFCNKLSEKAGVTPYYTINKTTADPSNKKKKDYKKYTVTINPTSNGYRLPTEAEWEYAAKDGAALSNFVFSGSDALDSVGWYQENSGLKSHLVGQKKPNDLGLYDLSGNVWEWCWDWYNTDLSVGRTNTQIEGPETGSYRSVRGGSWFVLKEAVPVNFRDKFAADRKYSSVGFRIVRSNL